MQAALKGVGGVSNAYVSMPDKAVVFYDSSQTDSDALLAAVIAVGYGVSVK